MGKWIAIPMVAAVLATITGMYYMFDREQGRPAAALSAARQAAMSVSNEAREKAASMPRLAADAAREVNENAAREAASAPAAPAQEKKLVQPEDLPQGFIIVVTDNAKKASRESPIHMPSSHNGWNPQDPGMKLEPQSDMKWRIEWSKPKLDSRIAFKFARGSWEQVETTADFKDIDNRMLPMVDVSTLKPGEKPIIELSIAQWRDNEPGRAKNDATNKYRAVSVSAGSIKRLEVTGGASASLVRDVLVWLPPDYDAPANASRTYPVLYMQDGQNLFEQIPGIPAEWQADETAAKLIAASKIEPLIIVGIPNAGVDRIREYSPVELVMDQPALADRYADFVLNTVMPRVERAFRVKTGPEHTAIGGSSLGAIVALDIATNHSDRFGKVLAESPSLSLNKRAAFAELAKKPSWPARIYMGMGGAESDNPATSAQQVAGAQAFAELAKGKGLKGDAFLLSVDDGAKHDEHAWAKRFPQALSHLFPAK